MMPIDLKELIIENRSIRTFDESVRFDRETLASFVDCARLSASARNAQTLKFRLVLEKDETGSAARAYPLGGGYHRQKASARRRSSDCVYRDMP